MADNETTADIIAEMRGIRVREFQEYADRLDAAHKRERGDCAKLREFARLVSHMNDDGYWNGSASICALVDKAEAALAEPVRNCDMGTPDEQAQRFFNFCTEHSSAIHGMCDYKCPCIDSGDKCHCLCKWAQMPYKEGGAK